MAENDELNIFTDDLLNQLHDKAKNKVDYWDIRAGVSNGNTIEFSDEKSKEITSYLLTGCSIRTFIDGGWGFNVLKKLSKKHLLDEFVKTIKMAKFSSSLCKFKYPIKERNALTQNFKVNSKRNLEDVDLSEKIEMVKEHESIASNYSKLIKNTRTIYLDSQVDLLFLDTFGSKVKQELEILRLFSSVYAQNKGIIQNGTNSVGGVGGFEVMNTEKALSLSKKSSEQAINLLNAKSPIGGSFSVILDSKLTGVFIHEALGHACEADLVLNKESILTEKIGEKIAIEDVSVVDDPRFGQGEKFNLPYELFGSYFIDEEGTPAQKTIIIKNGILQSFIHSLETASRMNVAPNGHGRANSNSSKPQVRMGFTYLEPKDWDLEEMIADTKNGILCEDFQYGYTDPTTGNFQFKCRISTNIENGEKKENLRDVSFGGMTLDVLNKISAIGNENTFNYSDGICGKGGQGIRVCDGGPYIRIDNLTVGGLN
ncbi:MAG: TldD/PmbA family protein [Candidatus Lokiarchaeota archaeon]|nr:TldD/PmbA family protein [Candidatus Lokiarchaeota archaeon]